jgi:hypothetical protein
MKVNTTDRGLLLDMAPAADDAQKNMHTSYVVVNHENYFNTKVINITKLLDSFLFKLTTKSTACRLSIWRCNGMLDISRLPAACKTVNHLSVVQQSVIISTFRTSHHYLIFQSVDRNFSW